MKIQSSIIENKFLRIRTINFGATLFEFFHKSKKINLILNLGGIRNYLYKNLYVGATCGRYAGRISNSKFKIKNKIFSLNSNEGNNTLHGGKKGFDRSIWKIKYKSKKKNYLSIIIKTLRSGFSRKSLCNLHI